MDERRVFSNEARNALIERNTARLIYADIILGIALIISNILWFVLYTGK